MLKESKGFTLIELLVVVALLGIVILIAVPRLVGYSSMTLERVCKSNRGEAERFYEAFLQTKDVDEEGSFDKLKIEYFDEVCPAGGIVTFEDGKVKCSLHKEFIDDDSDEPPPGDEVPWL